MLAHASDATETPDHSSMGNDEHSFGLAGRYESGDGLGGFDDAVVERPAGLTSRGAVELALVETGQLIRPPVLDFIPGQAAPLAHIELLEQGFDQQRHVQPTVLQQQRRRLLGPAQIRTDSQIEGGGFQVPSRRQGLIAAQIRQGRVGVPLPSPGGVPRRLSVTQEQERSHRGRRLSVPRLELPRSGTLSDRERSVTPYAKSDGRSARSEAVVGSTEDLPGDPTVALLLFAAARLAAGTGREQVTGRTVGQVLDRACARYGPEFAAVVGSAQVWVNGEPAGPEHALSSGDEVAVLPPVSGGI